MQVTRDDGRLTIAEVAELCGVSPVTVYGWKNRGYMDRDGETRHFLAVVKIDGRIFVDQIQAAKAEWHTRLRARRDQAPQVIAA